MAAARNASPAFIFVKAQTPKASDVSLVVTTCALLDVLASPSGGCAQSLSGQQVRAFVGTGEHELPDADIDLFSTLVSAEKDVGAELIGPPLRLARATKSQPGLLSWHQVSDKGKTAHRLAMGSTSTINFGGDRRRRRISSRRRKTGRQIASPDPADRIALR